TGGFAGDPGTCFDGEPVLARRRLRRHRHLGQAGRHLRRIPHQGSGGGRRLTPLKPEVSAGTPESGRLRLNEWTGRDGEKRSKLQVVADAVEFLDPPKKAGDPDGAHAGEGRSLLRGQDRS